MISGGLFTRDFLVEGVRDTEAWAAFTHSQTQHVGEQVAARVVSLAGQRTPTEAETEKDLIWPVLEQIGWSDMSVQQNLSAKARDDVPDALLFPSSEAKALAMPLEAWKRFQHGACVVEAKRWDRVLDREDARRRGSEGVPSTQMLRYLRRVDDVTGGMLRWGILTNGRHWRLYFRGALSVAEDFLEIDLGKLFRLPGCERDLLDRRPDVFATDAEWDAHVLRLFVLMFGREAFLPTDREETFHQLALREGKQWEAKVASDLSTVVFEVFPVLGAALAEANGRVVAELDGGALEGLREAALTLLYRLLFVLYAEDRNLLPDESGPYAEYSLTRLRSEIADKKARGQAFSDRMSVYWARLEGIFDAIAHGNNDLGIPAYNGGLFEPARTPLLRDAKLPDAVMGEVIFRLSHLETGDGRPPRYINYRDLSVQQLGSVYERILEHGFAVADGRIVPADDPAARKGSGSYYTPRSWCGSSSSAPWGRWSTSALMILREGRKHLSPPTLRLALPDCRRLILPAACSN